MYSYIRGSLEEVNIDSITVEANGVGYHIFIPIQSITNLPGLGNEVKVYTYLCVREDAMLLYGFLTRDELEMFKLLITVSGIGPKGGIGILSALSVDDLRFAVLSGDSKAISKAPGIGAKTAQRVILDLKDKISLEDAFESKLSNSGSISNLKIDTSVKNDAIMALEALGYSSSEALKAISKIAITEDMTVEELLSLTLKNI